jgi:hypothetical protein
MQFSHDHLQLARVTSASGSSDHLLASRVHEVVYLFPFSGRGPILLLDQQNHLGQSLPVGSYLAV